MKYGENMDKNTLFNRNHAKSSNTASDRKHKDNPGECGDCQVDCVDNVEFLEGLPVKQKQELMAGALHSDYRKGQFLFHEDEKVDSLFIIRKGSVKLSTWDSEGREQIIGIFADNDVIWEGMFLEESRYPYSAVCLKVTRICRIHRRDFERVVSDTEVALKVIGMLSRKLHDANARNHLLSITEPKARIAGFLLYRREHSTEAAITLRLDEIAASLAMRPETVSRKLRELVKEGLIRKHGQSSYEILDAEALRECFENG